MVTVQLARAVFASAPTERADIQVLRHSLSTTPSPSEALHSHTFKSLRSLSATSCTRQIHYRRSRCTASTRQIHRRTTSHAVKRARRIHLPTLRLPRERRPTTPRLPSLATPTKVPQLRKPQHAPQPRNLRHALRHPEEQCPLHNAPDHP